MSLYLLKNLNKINPKADHRWVPDGKNIWFLPCILDLINDTYAGYWYANKTYTEKLHQHTAISEGYVFYGEFRLRCNNKNFSIKKNSGFILPPNIPHTAKLIPEKQGFLYFGTVVGQAVYKNETLDAKSYYDEVIKHYRKHRVDLNRIFINNF